MCFFFTRVPMLIGCSLAADADWMLIGCWLDADFPAFPPHFSAPYHPGHTPVLYSFIFIFPTCTVATMRMHVLVDMLIGACDPMLSPIRGVRPVRQLRPRHLLRAQPRHHGYIFTPTSHSTFPTFFFNQIFPFPPREHRDHVPHRAILIAPVDMSC